MPGMTSVMKLFASGNGESLATIESIVDGYITALCGCIQQDTKVDGTGCDWELSFSSSAGHTSNDTRASIIGGSVILNFVTSGMGNNFLPFSLSNLQIPIGLGERLHAHIANIGVPTAAASMKCWLYLEQKRAPQRRASTRRVS